MKILMIVLACVSLAGCATQKGNTFYKDGGSEQEFAADFNQCLAEARIIQGNMGGMYGFAVAKSSRDRCMFGKGYTQQ